MKNFITVGTRVAVAALFSLAAAASAQAADCSFRPNAPDQHTVVRGDTLWGISGTFLEHPWCWPQVWGMNRDEIANPHWIYPGQIVYFDRKNGRLSLVKPGSGDGSEGLPTTRLSPQVRTEGMGDGAIASIPAGAIEPFLTRPLIVDEGQMKGAPRVVAQQDGHVYLGAGDKLYVRGDLRGSTSLPGLPARRAPARSRDGQGHCLRGRVPGQRGPGGAGPGRGGRAHFPGRFFRCKKSAWATCLMPTPPTPLRNYVPHPPSRPVKGRVLGMNAGLSFAAQNQVVSINRGSVDGIDVGAVLNLYHFGETITDPGGRQGILGLGRTALKLPDEEVGNLFVFRVFKNVSYGLIMQATQPVQIGDVAASPE